MYQLKFHFFWAEFIGACVITAAIALIFEGSRTIRDWLYLAFLKKRSCHLSSKDIGLKIVKQSSQEHSNGNGPATLEKHNGDSSTGKITHAKPVMATGNLKGHGNSCHKPKFYVGLLELSLSTLFHILQISLGYILMLQVMTFNVWIFVAVLAGTAVGFFMFDSFNKKIQAVKLSTSNVTK